MNAFNLILDQIAALRARMDRERTTLRLGTIQSSGTVLLTDGAEVTPAARLTDTTTGDIVLVGQHNRRAYVLGKPPGPALPRVHVEEIGSATTDASGFVTLTHGAPFTPAAVIVSPNSPLTSFAHFWGVDNITSSTCRARFGAVNTVGALASASTGPLKVVSFE